MRCACDIPVNMSAGCRRNMTSCHHKLTHILRQHNRTVNNFIVLANVQEYKQTPHNT